MEFVKPDFETMKHPTRQRFFDKSRLILYYILLGLFSGRRSYYAPIEKGRLVLIPVFHCS